MKNRIIDYIIILVFAIVISIPLMSADFNIYGDDGIQHIARLMGTYQTITEGEFPPVIMSNFCNGFGYSWNIFYSPFTAYLPLIFSIFTNSFELMLKLFIILVAFLSGIAMYEFVKKVSKNRYAGLLAAAIYVFAPYRLTDTYMRVAISELASFIFIPITFLGMYNIFNSEEKSIKSSLMLTLGAVGLIITHTVITMYVAIFCFIYLLLNIKSLKDKQVLKALGLNILLIILLSSFFIIPLLEHYLSADYEVFVPGRMERTSELIRNKVESLDLVYTEDNQFCFEIGLVTTIGIVLTLLAFNKVEKRNRKIYWFSFVAGIVCIIMSLKFFPFENLPSILKMIQFTFRLLEFSTFFLAFFAAYNYSLVIKNFNMRDVVILSIVAFLLIVPLKKNLNFEKRWSEDMLWPAVGVNDNTKRVHAGCATFEYLPSKAFENLDYLKHREDKVYVIEGDATISNEEKDGTNMTFEIESIEDKVKLELPYIYYLGYTVEITNDNGETKELETYESGNGFVAFDVSAADVGTVTVKYTGTVLMKISYAISAITFVGIVVWLVVSKIREKRRTSFNKGNNNR